jgi:lysozyme
MNIERLRLQITKHEGIELMPYRCTSDKLTIGVGRNIEDRGISHETAMQMLDEDIDICINELQQTVSYWDDLPERVQEALINLCFNMGISRLMAFKKTFGFLREGMYEKAADELLESRYANQVGQRAIDVANMIREGAEG